MLWRTVPCSLHNIKVRARNVDLWSLEYKSSCSCDPKQVTALSWAAKQEVEDVNLRFSLVLISYASDPLACILVFYWPTQNSAWVLVWLSLHFSITYSIQVPIHVTYFGQVSLNTPDFFGAEVRSESTRWQSCPFFFQDLQGPLFNISRTSAIGPTQYRELSSCLRGSTVQ